MHTTAYANEVNLIQSQITKEQHPLKKALLQHKLEGLKFRFQLELLSRLTSQENE